MTAEAVTFKRTVVSRLAIGLVVLILTLPVLADPDWMGLAWVGVVVACYVAACAWIARTRLVLDDAGVHVGRRHVRWDDIASYAYSANPRGGDARPGIQKLGAAAEAHWGKGVRIAYHLELRGKSGNKLRVTSAFVRADDAIRMILARVHPPLATAARTCVEAGDELELRPLQLSSMRVQVPGQKPLKVRAIDKVDIWQVGNSTRLRILGSDDWTYASIDTRHMTGAPIALEMFRVLGIEVHVPPWFTP